MKKIIFLFTFVMVGVLAFAQIGAVKPKEKTWSVTTYSSHVGLYEEHKTEPTMYSLNLTSDDSHDKVKVSLSLGNKEQAIESLNNLLALYDMTGEVNIFDHRFICGKKELKLKKEGNLKSTYGSYCIEKNALEKMLKDLME